MGRLLVPDENALLILLFDVDKEEVKLLSEVVAILTDVAFTLIFGSCGHNAVQSELLGWGFVNCSSVI